jgi:transposase-like protein
MQDVFCDFTWWLPPAYEWLDCFDKRGRRIDVPQEWLDKLESEGTTYLSDPANEKVYGPVLTEALPDPWPNRSYRPMDRPNAGLFREFGELDYKDPAAILKFANKYGRLGLSVGLESGIELRDLNGQRRDHEGSVEPFLRWAEEIVLMREAIGLVGRRLDSGKARPLEMLFQRNLSVNCSIAFGSTQEPRMEFKPLTLHSAMWLQLALALVGDKRYERCKFCGRVLEISTDDTGFRSHREFCTESCKTKDYRKRKRAALDLLDDGVPVRQIAERTKTKLPTVRAWLKRARTPSGQRGA